MNYRHVLLLSFLALCSVQQARAQDDTQEAFEAVIEQQTAVLCHDGSAGCLSLVLTGTSGSFRNRSFTIRVSPSDWLSGSEPPYDEGKLVVVQTQIVGGERQYFISDTVRRPALLLLAALFIAAVFAFGGAGAVRSFAGMIVSFLVLFVFILPSILSGNPPLLVTIAGSMMIMLATFIVCHGWNRKSLAALGGTGVSLILTGILAYAFSAYASLTGGSDEELLFLLADFPDIDTRGIILSGIIIGTLGVLDDVTISQASAVFELRAANALLTWKQLFSSAYRIGRDHIAAAVNTLVLAYAGASLPLLLLITGMPVGESLLTTINREMIATEIVRTLVGSIGLLAAVPLTTVFAALLAIRSHPEATGHSGHHH